MRKIIVLFVVIFGIAKTGTAIEGTIVDGINLLAKLNSISAVAEDDSTYLIIVNRDEIILPQRLDYEGKNITVVLQGNDNMQTINRNADSFDSITHLFTVESGVTLILDNNITLHRGGVRINAGGTLIMNAGSCIAQGIGSGVHVNDNGIFIMNAGTIRDNSSYLGGGGVRISSNGTFTMNGGLIINNTTTRMSGVGGDGGGVSILTGGRFIMTGGEISGNTASRSGGGVYVAGFFNINRPASRASIHGNSAAESPQVYFSGPST